MMDEKQKLLNARYYGKRGVGGVEDEQRCVVEVQSFDGWRSFQCSRLRGHGPGGLLCWQHARQYDEGRSLNVPPKGVEDRRIVHKERNPL